MLACREVTFGGQLQVLASDCWLLVLEVAELAKGSQFEYLGYPFARPNALGGMLLQTSLCYFWQDG